MWPFLHMRNSKLGKKNSRSEGVSVCQNFVSKRKLVMYALLIKWSSNMQRNVFFGNNSRMNIDRPKSAIVTFAYTQDSSCKSVITNIVHLKQQERQQVQHIDIYVM